MMSLVLILSVGMLPADHSSPDHQPTPGSAGVTRQAGSSLDDDAVRRLVAEPLEVARTYEMLLSKNKRDRMQAYAQLPSSMKSAMWTHQLLTALAQHPEFTEEQRRVLYDALDLFTPELFEITFTSPDWSKRVDQPLHSLEQRAKAAFGIRLAGQLFAQLGQDDPAGSASPNGLNCPGPR